jgi:hypothetical protein
MKLTAAESSAVPKDPVQRIVALPALTLLSFVWSAVLEGMIAKLLLDENEVAKRTV